MSKRLKIILAFGLVAQIIGLRFLKYFPEFVETVYSNGIYKWISQLMHYAFGWLPFSFGDLFYTVGGILIIRWLILHRKRIFKDTVNWSIDILSTISILYFAFHALWAFNYYRLPLHQSLQLKATYSTESLMHVTQNLIDRTNSIHNSLSLSDTLKIEYNFDKTELLNKVPLGYQELSKQYSHLAYNTKSIKRSLYSIPLTYMGFSGYLNPFTNEAQIDGLIPGFKYPSTASHEVAHQLGYAAENEANFIGSLAAIHHPDIYFRYSGYAFALNHCLGELYKRAPKQYDKFIEQINTGVLKNYNDVSLFWERYKNPLEPLFKTTYSGFLKANNQSAGIKSYSYVVALYVNYFEQSKLLNR
ncbi:DUF3810 domain-containing protein [Ichthyenterobacterium sp. W332]|uniref:DUF3810 domain-containing protein n=1 Tax=Microcosmobacter mediterraneus TaxID=3075607 RepID=A0ABU2YGM6_9FLAO|nr:DUF3810 domain-containing protein [Ichthyenterobacterium sp. W332]MDT0557187.1 DUF3810 domain-containing protein [Ichthyenterobacterium sp. W332]